MTHIQLADVNGDGKPDLVGLAGGIAGGIGVLLGNGDGTFQAEQTFAAAEPSSITVSDINGDGKPDVIVPSYGYDRVSILYGNGDGRFQPPQTLAANTPNAVAVADLNGDGRADLVSTDRFTGGLTVWLGDFASGFSGQVYTIQTQVVSIDRTSPVNEFTSATSVNYTVTFSTDVSGVAAADFKVITTGGVDVGGPLTVTPVSASVYTVTIGSIYGEGAVELDFVDNGSIMSATGNPLRGPAGSNGSFQGEQYDIAGQVGPQVLFINRETPISPVAGDGSVKFLVLFNESVTGVVDPSDFQVAASGNVRYAPPLVVSGGGAMYTVTVNGVTGGGSIGLNLIDPSNIRDLAGIPLSQPGEPVVFQPQQTFATGGTTPYSVVAADVNGDGMPDAVVINRASNSVSVLLGNGDGTFALQTYAVGLQPVSLAVADVNGDGIPDLVVGNYSAPGNFFSNSISVLLGNGNGTFKPQRTIYAYGHAAVVAVGDLNGDGKPDIAVTSVMRDVLLDFFVMLGNGDGIFEPEQGSAPGASRSC